MLDTTEIGSRAIGSRLLESNGPVRRRVPEEGDVDNATRFDAGLGELDVSRECLPPAQAIGTGGVPGFELAVEEEDGVHWIPVECVRTRRQGCDVFVLRCDEEREGDGDVELAQEKALRIC